MRYNSNLITFVFAIQVIGELFARHLDLDYAVSDTRDRFKRHRALLLRRPTLDLSGSYTCKVSTFTDEEVKRKSMTIYGEQGGMRKKTVSGSKPSFLSITGIVETRNKNRSST